MDSVNEYKHTAITAPRTIRLLEVRPGKYVETVHLSLKITALDDAPEFEAISYCWGDASDQRSVMCDGATLSITNSLFTGLLHFRYRDRPRVLWADAVCIDQTNGAEKSSQVLLMPYIYSKAESVLVWLGVADDPFYGFVPPGVVDTIQLGLQLVPSLGFQGEEEDDDDEEPEEDYSEEEEDDGEEEEDNGEEEQGDDDEEEGDDDEEDGDDDEEDGDDGGDEEEEEGLVVMAQKARRSMQRQRGKGEPNALDLDWAPFSRLLARPWFRRKWVVQEVALGKEVLLYVGGGIVIQWQELLELSRRMHAYKIEELIRVQVIQVEDLDNLTPAEIEKLRINDEECTSMTDQSLLESFDEPLKCIVSIGQLQHIGQNGTLLDAIIATTRFSCTEERDHVYSLLNLVDGATIQPDYEVSVGEVFWRLAIMTLFEDQDMKLLSMAPHRHRFPDPDSPRFEGLPSWVPDLREIHLNIMPTYLDKTPAFSAGGEGYPVLSLSDDQRVLGCQGRLVDTVRVICTPFVQMILEDKLESKGSTAEFEDSVEGREAENKFRWIAKCYRLAFGHEYDPEESCLDEELMETFSRTMLCDKDPTSARAHPETISAFPQYIQILHERAYGECSVTVSGDLFDQTLIIEDTMDTHVQALTFCVTDSGRFGNIPPASLPGDFICVLIGAEVPFVIRPTGKGTYRLIGECYLDGIMDGEEIEEVDSGFLETIELE